MTDFHKRLYECLKSKKIKSSKSREAVFQILLDSKECMTVNQIASKLNEIYPKKVSINTIYRHLNLFVDCDLVLVLQDDYKRAYYCIKENQTMMFVACTRCKKIKRIKDIPGFKCLDFKKTKFIVFHKECFECEQRFKWGMDKINFILTPFLSIPYLSL